MIASRFRRSGGDQAIKGLLSSNPRYRARISSATLPVEFKIVSRWVFWPLLISRMNAFLAHGGG